MYINIGYNINDYINKIGWHTYVYTFFLLNDKREYEKWSIENLLAQARHTYIYVCIYIICENIIYINIYNYSNIAIACCKKRQLIFFLYAL